MSGAIPPLPQYVFMAWCLVKHRDNFTFTLPKTSDRQRGNMPDFSSGDTRMNLNWNTGLN
jgi:hypothetical protein